MWTVRLPRKYNYIYYIADDVYVAYYDHENTPCVLMMTDTVEEYYRLPSEYGRCFTYDTVFRFRGAAYEICSRDKRLYVAKCANEPTVVSSEPFSIGSDNDHDHYRATILWTCCEYIIVYHGLSLAKVRIEWG